MKKKLENKKIFLCCTLAYILLSVLLAIFIEYKIKTAFEITRFMAVIVGCSLIGSIFLSIFRDGIKDNIVKIIKMLFSIILLMYVTYTYHKVNIIIYGILELGLITYISNYLISKNKIIGNIVGNLLYLLLNANLCVYYFGSSYVNLIMLENLASADNLSGKAIQYILGVIFVLTFSTLFYKSNKKYYQKELIIVIITIAAMLVGVHLDLKNIYLDNGPLGNYFVLIQDTKNYYRIKKIMKSTKLDKNDFYHDEIEDYYDKDSDLPEKPNVILIFTEGLSSNVIYDSRNIMPNLKEFSTQSISFDNYYNHMAATYRGIIGQLYSGFQFDNDETNYLVSLHEILGNEGYYSSFINIDVNTGLFGDYLTRMRFDEVYNIKGTTDGAVASFSDKKAYEELFNLASEYNEKDEPFFLSIYTMGTHVSLDSIYEKYGDGKNSVLNRLYDVDYQFGEFIKKFNESDLSDNTIIVFTSDHASYVDKDYSVTFPKYKRPHNFFDEVPLFIYYKGIDARSIDVSGRTSLDLAPTILDFLDISAENYFMGKSLFSDSGNGYDHYFFDGGPFMKTNASCEIEKAGDSKELTEIYNYFGVATKSND